MNASINFTIPTPIAGQDAAVKVLWYDSADGVAFAKIGESLISALTPINGVYTWTLSAADTARYQQIRTETAGAVPSFFGAILPPLPDNPLLQTITGNVKEFGAATWSVGDTVELTIEQSQLVGSIVLEPVLRSIAVNANGLFSLAADKGASVTLSVKYAATGKVYFSKSFTVSDDAVKDIKEY